MTGFLRYAGVYNHDIDQAVLLSMENNLENSKYVYLHLNLQCFYFLCLIMPVCMCFSFGYFVHTPSD